MILLRAISFLAVILVGVWYFLAEPDRTAEIAAVERELQHEVTLRETALTAALEMFESSMILVARSAEVAALTEDLEPPTRMPGVMSGIATAVPARQNLSEAEALAGLLTLETLTGLQRIRVLKRDAQATVPAIDPPADMTDDGSWQAGIDAAFQGRPARAAYRDAEGNPYVVFFTPFARDLDVPAIVIADAPLADVQTRWQTSRFRLSLTDALGDEILTSSEAVGDDIMAERRDVPGLNAIITAAAPRPPQVGPWAIRSGIAILFGVLVLLIWEQQRARNRGLAEIAEVRRHRVSQLEQELEKRMGELDHISDELAINKNLALVGEVSSSIAQEINAPVSAIKAQVEAANRALDARDTDGARRDVEQILSLTDRISRLAGNLRGFVTSEPYHIEPVSIRPVVHEAAVKILDQHPSLGDYFFLEVADSVPDKVFVRADKVRLGQVLSSLLASSWNACRDQEDPELVISIQQTPDNIVVAIDHNAPTEPPAAAQTGRRINIGAAAAKGATPALSAGFTISKSFVEGMGGTLVSRESALGGARIEVILPKFRARHA